MKGGQARIDKSKHARINRDIRAQVIRLIGADGDQLGVVPITEAMEKAEEAGLDLVEVAAEATPPVCKIMDYGKFLYQQSKKSSAAKKKQKQLHVKEVKLKLNVDTHDYNVKLDRVKRFLTEGNKVKITIWFRGREIIHLNKGRELVERVLEDVKDYGQREGQTSQEGKRMVTNLLPKKH